MNTRPTNCGFIVNGSRGETIQGPLEWDNVWGYRPPHEYPRWVIEAHMENVYAEMGGTKDTLPSDQFLWPIPDYNTFFVRVVLELPSYLLAVELYHSTGQYTCYGVVNHTHTIIAVHHIYGKGNLLSIVQMVREYCDKEAPRYAQCRTCRFCSRDLLYCGRGLEMNTGTCNYHKCKPSPLRWRHLVP
ncbi:hypothetical protein [Microcoleus phage My-WqHQDG]|nr:hypothetical protein [Microcoleus phage My-WqHQDG]